MDNLQIVQLVLLQEMDLLVEEQRHSVDRLHLILVPETVINVNADDIAINAPTCAAGTFLQWTGSAFVCTAPGAGSLMTIGTIDSVAKSANGAVVSGSNILMQTADASFPGLVSTGTQTFAGAKTFAGAATFNTNTIFATMTPGSVFFAGAAGLLSQSNAQYFWDNTNSRLGIGTNTPGTKLHINSGLATNTVAIETLANTVVTIKPLLLQRNTK
jgi:hypothetical protein